MKFAFALVVSLATLVAFTSCRVIPEDEDFIADNDSLKELEVFQEPSTDQPPVSDPSEQPPVSDPSTEPPVSDPSTEPPVGDPSTEPPVSDPSTEPPVGDPSTEPPVGDPSTEPPVGDPSTEPPVGDPSTEKPPVTDGPPTGTEDPGNGSTSGLRTTSFGILTAVVALLYCTL